MEQAEVALMPVGNARAVSRGVLPSIVVSDGRTDETPSPFRCAARGGGSGASRHNRTWRRWDPHDRPVPSLY
jgi:hypothetical protein